MILDFASDETEKIWRGEFSRKLPVEIQTLARRKLRMLNNAAEVSDLKQPPGNHLEQLKGSRKGQFSIRVNQQWRICFEWSGGHSSKVEIVDYH